MEKAQVSEYEPDSSKLHSAWIRLKSDPGRARRDLEVLAEQGSTMSLVYLGYLYEKGLGTPQDLGKAEVFLRDAAQRGSTSALFQLGELYLVHKQEREKAAEFLAAAAARNHARAMYWLAHVQLENGGSERVEQAVRLLKQASDLGHIQSQRRLGLILMRGHSGLRSFFHGLQLFLQAAGKAAKLAVDDPENEHLRDLPI